MMRRSIVLLLLVALLFSLPAYADDVSDNWDYNDAADEEPELTGSLDYFVAHRVYQDNFTDVATDAWYYSDVKSSYECQLIDGTSSTTFSPNENITLAACIKLAACLCQVYYEGEVYLINSETGNWYDSYVNYCEIMEITTGDYPDYNQYATRADVAAFFVNALPAVALEEVNTIKDGAIPDVDSSTPGFDAIYTLYRAGIFAGRDSEGSFHPDAQITRAEVAAVLSRMANPNLRMSSVLS